MGVAVGLSTLACLSFPPTPYGSLCLIRIGRIQHIGEIGRCSFLLAAGCFAAVLESDHHLSFDLSTSSPAGGFLYILSACGGWKGACLLVFLRFPFFFEGGGV